MTWFLGTSHSTVFVQFVCRKRSPTSSSILKTVWAVCVCCVYILISDTKESVVSCHSLSSTPDSRLFSLWPISGHSNTDSRELRYSPGKCVSPLWSVSHRVYTIVIQLFFDGSTAACFESFKMCTADKERLGSSYSATKEIWSQHYFWTIKNSLSVRWRTYMESEYLKYQARYETTVWAWILGHWLWRCRMD